MTENLKVVNPCILAGCSACCRDVTIRLSGEESAFMRRSGTTLHKKFVSVGLWGQSYLSEPDDGKTTYIMDGACGNLTEQGLCGVHDDPSRPEICGTTKAGGYGCLDVRKEKGLPPITLGE